MPKVIEKIEALMEYETAGDPITGLKWTRKATEKIAKELGSFGISVGRTTVGKLLKKMDFSLKVNHKKKALGANKTPEARAQRDKQFRYIKEHFVRNLLIKATPLSV
jgi:hypothetical protein